MCKSNIFPDISINSEKNDIIDYVTSRKKLSQYIFQTYHWKGNLMVINNYVSTIGPAAIFSRYFNLKNIECFNLFLTP